MPKLSALSGQVRLALISQETSLSPNPSELVPTRPGQVRNLSVPPVPSLLRDGQGRIYKSGRNESTEVVK